MTGMSPFALAGTETDLPATADASAALSQDAASVDAVGIPQEAASMLRIVGTEVVSQLTGPGSSNDTAARWDVYGTDLGHMFRHRGDLYMVFGDTFGRKSLTGRRNWRSNTMARIADPDPRNGLPIETMIVGRGGSAKELIPSRKVDGVQKTVIPTYGISVGERMYLHYMSVTRWGAPGRWDVGHSRIAYSDDDGQNWVSPAGAAWPGDTGFEQVAFVHAEDTVYTFGIPEGRFGGVRLRRVAPEQILATDAYQYWDGDGWGAEPSAAATIVPAPVGELSVAWSETHGRWLMMYLQPERHAIVLRTAPELVGPWSDGQVVATAEDYAGLYAPYIVPGTDIDTDLYYTMSLWDPYNVFLMHTTLDWGGVATASAADGPEGDGTVPD